MRVLVTGSSGQLGREVARQLAARYDVLGLDLQPGPRTTHVGSVTDRALVGRLAANTSAIVHTASLHAPHVAGSSTETFERVNVEGTRLLLEAATAESHSRFVYTSTTSVYGDAMAAADRAVWVDESLAPEPRDIYDRTKLAAEALCEDVAERRRLPVTCLRVSRFFPEEAESVAAYRLYRGLDPRDCAAAHLLALDDGRAGFQLYNISARSPFGPEELAALQRDPAAVIARRQPGLAEAFRARGWRLPASIDRVYVVRKAERGLGWAPRYGVESLLHRSADRWLYHLVAGDDALPDPYAPPSLAIEGFIHCSYRPAVAESARLYFPPGAPLRALQIDPRRAGVAIEEEDTPRGPMPHLHGPLRRAAIAATLPLEALDGAPDAITSPSDRR